MTDLIARIRAAIGEDEQAATNPARVLRQAEAFRSILAAHTRYVDLDGIPKWWECDCNFDQDGCRNMNDLPATHGICAILDALATAYGIETST